MNPLLRQGDVLIIPSETPATGTKLSHLTLAEGGDYLGKSWHSS